MIRLEGTRIKLNQGETGSIVFFIKDLRNDFPYILPKLSAYWAETSNGYIEFTVRKGPYKNSQIVLRKSFDVDSTREDSYNWYRFTTTNIIEEPESSADKQIDTLYWYTNDTTHKAFQFYKDDEFADPIQYDYTNSSVEISFDYEDTEALSPETYYYELAYVLRGKDPNTKKEKIIEKRTFVSATEFVITGALFNGRYSRS